jgi:tetratricopeptide (TPR) repeat protein
MIAFLAAVLAAVPALAQEDYELANALAERGWYDLSEELFGRLLKSSDAGARAEGRYGQARIRIIMAEKAESTEEKGKLYDGAIREVEAFLKEFPGHKRRGEALSDIGSLYQSKGKALMALAKADPSKVDEAEKAFGSAEKLFQDLIEQLKKDEKKRPEPDEEKKNPSKFKADLKAFEEWEEKMMYAKYNYAVSLFAHAETYKDNPSKHPDMRRLLEKMNSFLNNDFMWLYEWYLLAYDAFIYMGRAYQILAEASDRERAEESWKQCFTFINKAKGLLSDPENRKNEAIRDICSRALLYEMKARLAYGDAKRGPASLKQFNDAARLAEDFFRTFPTLRFEEVGKAIRLEQARAYCKAGQVDKGIKLLQELAKQFKDSWVENIAVDIMGEYAGAENVNLAVDAADNYFERGPAFLYKAIQKYRKALQSAKRAEDEKFKPYCWYQIGRCYYYLDRYYEASAALSELEKAPLNKSSQAPEAALLKRSALARIAKITKDKADEKALEDYRAWLVRTYKDVAGDQEIRQLAIDAEAKQKFLDAVKEWEKIAQPNKALYEEAVFSMGLDYYREGDRVVDLALKEKAGPDRDKLMAQAMDHWKKALEAFQKHLAHVDKMPTRDARTVKNAIGSILFSSKILVHPRIDKAPDALKISEDLEKRFPNADPKLVIAIMSLRLNAKVKMGQIQEAEDDFRALKAKYEKERIGSDYYMAALAVLANAFQEAAAKERDKDAEKHEIYSEKAGDYFYSYFNLNPDASKKPEQIEGMADMLFFVAEQRLKKGQTRNSKEDVERAREIYKQARDLFKEYLLNNEPKLSKDQVRTLNRKITRCHLMTGQFEEAIKIYLELTKADPDMKDGSAHEDLADCYMERANASPKGANRNEFFRQADKIYGRLAAMLTGSQLFNEHTWRLLYKHVQCLYELDIDQARFFFDSYDLKGYGGKWDEDEKGVSKWGYKPKFEEIRKMVDEKVPPKKSSTP